MNNKYTLENANKFIEENKKNVEQEYMHKFHFDPTIGWINDPNGLTFYKGEYHLFYQFYPYDSVWGPMHWGHATSKDLIKWNHEKVALAPSEDFDNKGCFSGTAIVENERHILMYTGVTTGDFQRQCLAIGDGESYEKYANNPVISEEQLPDTLNKKDFRDPKLFMKNGKYYCVAASKTLDSRGCLVIFESIDKYNWEFKNIFDISTEVNNGSYECPDFFELDNVEALIVSPIGKRPRKYNFYNLNSCMLKIGNFNEEKYEFISTSQCEIDNGFDFYAAQTLLDDKGRRIMIAWMAMWGRKLPSNDKNHKWAGSMTIPREIKIIDNKLLQYPVAELENYRTNEYETEITLNGVFSNEKFYGKYIDLEIEFDVEENLIFEVNLFSSDDEKTIFRFDVNKKLVTFDRSNSGINLANDESELSYLNERHATISFDKKVKARFILDNTSVEAFFNHGEKAMTGNIYSENESNNISFFTNKKTKIKIRKFDLEG